MLKGLPASGKSTYAKELVDEMDYLRINKDDLRKMLHNGKFGKRNEAEVLFIRNALIENAIAHGRNIVVDDTNFEPKHQELFEKLANTNGASFRVLFIDTPLEECISRNERRADKVPLSVITSMHSRHIATLKQERVEYNENLEECIIVDIDGTLAHLSPDSNGSTRDIYDASRAGEDSVDDAVSNVMAMAYGHGYKVIILSGRGKDEGHRETTEAWLDNNGIDYDELHTRQVGDERPDTEVKKELYDKHIKNKYNVKYVIDDRPSVCRMWRELGLFTFQVGNVHHEF